MLIIKNASERKRYSGWMAEEAKKTLISKNFWAHRILLPYIKKHKSLMVGIASCEKYNNDSNNEPVEVPRADGSFDIEGTFSCDVNAYAKMQWNLSHIKSYIGAWFSWAYDLLIENRDLPWSYHREVMPKPGKMGGWAFIVDSKKSIKYEIAEAEIFNESWNKPHFDTNNFYAVYKKKAAAISDKEVETFLSAGHLRLLDGLWVDRIDPTKIIVDELIHPHAMKDGWSHAQIQGFIALWFKNIYGIEPVIEEVPAD